MATTEDPRNKWDDGYNEQYSQPLPQGDLRAPSQHNGLAIASLIFGIFFWPLGLVFGYMSLHEAKKAGRKRSGLAIAGVVVSWVALALIFLIVIIASAHSTPSDQFTNCINNAIQNGTDPNLCH